MDIDLTDLGATALTTLFCRARSPLIEDPQAEALARRLAEAEPKLDDRAIRYIAIRALCFDRYVRARHPNAYVVNLGCGFDTRFHRLDDGRLRLFDVDRADVLKVKRRLLEETDRYRFVEADVTDEAWLDQLPPAEAPPLFLAEGLFMYLPRDEIKALVLRLQRRFPGAELVAEVVHRRWLRKWIKWSIDLKLRWKYGFGKDATFRSGLQNSREMETWGPGIEFIDEWCAVDEDDAGIPLARVWRRFEFFRKTQWVVHYRLKPVPG